MSRIGRTFPPQIGIPNQFGITQHALGPRAPQQPFPPLANPLTPGLLQVKVTLAARNRRLTQVRRFPLPGFEQDPTQTTVAQVALQDHVAGSNFGGTGLLLGDSATDAAYGQQFALATGTTTVSVKVTCKTNGTPTDSLVAEIRTDSAGLPSNTVLASGSVLGSTIDNSGLVDITIPLSAASITGTVWLVLRRSGAVDAVNNYTLGLDNAASPEGPWSQFNGTSWGFTDPRAILSTLTVSVSTTAYVLPARFLGPQPPQLVRPLPTSQQTTVAVNQASGFLVNQRRAQQRRARSRLFPPTVLRSLPVVTTLSINTATGVLTNWRRAQQRRTSYDLRPPTVVRPTPTLQQQTISHPIGLRTRPRPRTAYVDGPVLVAQRPPVAPPLNVNVATGVLTNWRRAQQRRTRYRLAPPTRLAAPFIAPPLNVNGAVDLLRRRYISTRRFPLQGWEQTSVFSPSQQLPATDDQYGGIGGTTTAIGFDNTTTAIGMPFTGISGQLSSVTVQIGSISGAGANLVFEIHPDSGGSPVDGTVLATATVPAASVVAAGDTVADFSSSGLTLAAGTTYWLTLSKPGHAVGTTDHNNWRASDLAAVGKLRDNAGSWTDASASFRFKVTTGSPPAFAQVLVRRNLGVFPPLFINAAPPAVTTLSINPASGLLTNQRRNTQRRTLYDLFGFIPQVSAQPPPPISVNVASGLLTRQRRAQQRRTDYLLAPPPVAAAGFVAPPLSVNCLQPDRLARRHRRQIPSTTIFTPAVLAPIVVSISVNQPPLTVGRRHRRLLSSFLTPPTVLTALTVFAGPQVKLVAVARSAHSTRRFPLQGWNETPAEMAAPSGAWEAAVIQSAPDAWWRLGDSGTAVDRVGGRNLTYNAAVVTGQEGLPVGSADGSAQFPGTAGGIASAAGLTPLLLGQTDWTIELWYAGRGAITSFYNEVGSVNDRIDVQGTGTSGPSVIVISDAGIDVNNVFTPATRMADGARRHVVFVKSGTTITAFIDGVAGTPQTFTFRPQTDPTSTISIGTSTKAWVDEMVVYRRALSTAEAQAHYTAGAVGPAPPLVYVQRFLGPRAPRLIFAIAPTIKIEPPTVALTTRQNPNLRRTHSFLLSPQVLAQPPPIAPISVNIASGVLTRQRRAQQRRTTAFLGDYIVAPVTVVFYGPAAHLAKARPRPTIHSLPAVTYPATSRITVTLVRARPRHTIARLTAISYPQTSIVDVNLTRTRPRPTARRLTPPQALQVFAGPVVVLTRTRPRHTVARVAAPTVVRVPVVEQQEQTVRVTVVRSRPRATTTFLSPPASLSTQQNQPIRTIFIPRAHARPPAGAVKAPATLEPWSVALTERTLRITLARTRPRPTIHRLTAVSYPATSRIVVEVVRVRPRPTRKYVAPAATLEPAAVAQAERTIRTTLVHARPRPTSGRLFGVLVAPVQVAFFGPDVTLARIRPRPTIARLTRVVYAATSKIQVTLVRSRPRPTTRDLAAPATLEPFAVELRERRIVTLLVTTRPRPTVATLTPPTVTQTFFGPEVVLTRIRPRPTVRDLAPPSVLRVPFVEQQEDTVRVTLVRARPRPTVRLLTPPTVLRVFTGPAVTLVKTRPRPTGFVVRGPRVIRIPSVEQSEQTIRVTLVHTRPRATVWTVRAPRVIRVPQVEQAEQTIRVALVRTRPRPTTDRLFPPAVVITFPPVSTTFLPAHTVKTRPRPTTKRLAPPRVVIPTPSLRAQTVTVALTHTRPRKTITRLTPPTRLFPPSLIQKLATITVVQVRTRPRHTAAVLAAPIFYKQTSEITVTLVRARPRPTTRVLGKPIFYRQSTLIEVTLVRTRPRPTTRDLAAPAVVRYAPVETTIATTLARIRPRPTSRALGEPTVLRTFAGPNVTVVHTRPRPTTRTLHAPTVIRRIPVETAIRTRIVATRPRPTTRTLRAPAVVRFNPVETTVRTHLVATRPRPTTHRLPPILPRVPADTTILVSIVRTRPRATVAHVFAPTVINPAVLPLPDQRTITVKLVRVPARYFRPTLAYVSPPPFSPPVPGFTDGYNIGDGAEGYSMPAAATDTETVPGSAGEGEASAKSSGSITSVPAAAAEIYDQQGGLPT